MRHAPSVLGVVGAAAVLAFAGATSADAAPTVTRTTLSYSALFANGSVAYGVNAAGTAWGDGSRISGVLLYPSCNGGICIPVPGFTGASRALLWSGTSATDISPAGASSAQVTGLGNDGTAIGTAEISSTLRSFIWKAGKTTLLPVGTWAEAVASNGLVAVSFADFGDEGSLGLWNNGVTTTVATDVPARGIAVNAAGTIAVDEKSEDTGLLSIVVFSGGKSATLPRPAGTWFDTYLVSLDDQGRILGEVDDYLLSGVTVSDGVLWKGTVGAGTWSGTMTTYLPLAGNTQAEPLAMNSAGVVVGSSGNIPAEWPATGGVPKAISADTGAATGISDNGTVIGHTGTGVNNARIWTSSGATISAFTSSTTSGALTGISPSGLIVGWGQQHDSLDGSNHGYEWKVTGT